MSLDRLDALDEQFLHQPLLAPMCRPDSRDTLMDRYREVARAVPDHIAVVADDGTITYDRLLHRAYADARKIAGVVGFGHGPIAVDVDCSIDSLSMMLAVIASGHSLVPLDAGLPIERKHRIIELAGAVHLQRRDLDLVDEPPTPLPTVTGAHTAIISFTSGSTGEAKGVILSHRMCLTKAYEVASAMSLGTHDRVGNALPVSFGAGVNTLFAGLLSGARVFCRDPRSAGPDAAAGWIQESSLTTLHCSPSLFRALPGPTTTLSARMGMRSLRLVATYGESLHGADVREFRSVMRASATIYNWYATTEAGGIAYNRFAPEREIPESVLPAGSPVPTKIVDVVRADDTVCAPNETGEIRVTAACLADGYLGLPELSAQRFSIIGDGIRVYRTGDLGRYDANGVLHLVGRVDDAVKVRGYLVEPAEVEGALRAVEGIADAFVVGSDADTVDLIGYVAPGTGEALPSTTVIRNSLRLRLPEWMIPTHIVALDRVPRTERGKVDRAALPDPMVRGAQREAATPTEWIVATIAKKTLGLGAVGRDEDFVSLGATSLTVTAMLTDLREVLAEDLSAEDLFGASTVRTLSAVIDTKLRTSAQHRKSHNPAEVLVPLRTEGSKPPVFLIGGAGVGAMAFLNLVRHLDPDRPVYALQAHAREKRGLPDRTVAATAHRYVDAIRAEFPDGPYHLVGHSLGGWIALEMAKRFELLTGRTEHVVLLDTRLFRYLLDRLPGGADVPAAPPAETREDAGFVLSRFGLVKLWLRIRLAGLLQFPTTTQWLVFASIGYIALQRHRPTPWAGPVTVVRTPDNVADPRSWRVLVTGELAFTEVSGLHQDMLRGPDAAALADAINTALDLRG